MLMKYTIFTYNHVHMKYFNNEVVQLYRMYMIVANMKSVTEQPNMGVSKLIYSGL